MDKHKWAPVDHLGGHRGWVCSTCHVFSPKLADDRPDEEGCRPVPRLAGFVRTCSEYDGDAPAGPLCWYWIKGDEDSADFADAVNWDYETDYTEDDVQHAYCRNVPTGIGGDQTMNIVKPGASLRGAYRITYIDVDAVQIARYKARAK